MKSKLKSFFTTKEKADYGRWTDTIFKGFVCNVNAKNCTIDLKTLAEKNEMCQRLTEADISYQEKVTQVSLSTNALEEMYRRYTFSCRCNAEIGLAPLPSDYSKTAILATIEKNLLPTAVSNLGSRTAIPDTTKEQLPPTTVASNVDDSSLKKPIFKGNGKS